MNQSRRAGKMLQWDYDKILAAGDDECCFSLSKRDVALIMAITDQIGWQTRYFSTELTEVDTDKIDAWKAGLETRLMKGCCPDGTLSRFDEDGDYQTSIDGGATWQDDIRADPRNQGVLAPPLTGSGDTTKCAAADNARDQFKATRDTLISLLEAGTTLLAILSGIMGFVGVMLGASGVATALGVLLVALAGRLLALTPESVEEQLDDTAMNDFRCILYCHAEDNGQFTYNGWKAVLTDIDNTFSNFPRDFFHGIVAAMGYIGLSNAGTVGTAEAEDCGDCDCASEWCHIFDFVTGGAQGWVSDLNTYSPGVGWPGVAYGTGGGVHELQRVFAESQITSMSTVHSASGYGGWQKLFRLQLDSDPFQDHSVTENGFNGDDILTVLLLTEPTPMTRLQLFFDGAASDNAVMKEVQICGIGVNPFEV